MGSIDEVVNIWGRQSSFYDQKAFFRVNGKCFEIVLTGSRETSQFQQVKNLTICSYSSYKSLQMVKKILDSEVLPWSVSKRTFWSVTVKILTFELSS